LAGGKEEAMASETKVTIDREGCISCGLCWETCPDFFEPSPEDDRSQVVAQYRVEGDPAAGMAPEHLRELVHQAADDCPVEVIHAG
jgi:ferredoxin